MNDDHYLNTCAEVGEQVIDLAREIFNACAPDDFAIQTANVFGGHNRIVFSPVTGFWADPSYCHPSFIRKFDAFMERKKAPPARFIPGLYDATVDMTMDDVEVEVEVQYTKGDAGDRMNPPDPGEVNVVSVKVKGDLKDIIEGSTGYMLELEGKIEEHEYGKTLDYAEYQYEMKRDEGLL